MSVRESLTKSNSNFLRISLVVSNIHRSRVRAPHEAEEVTLKP